jgi:hypothetical protein
MVAKNQRARRLLAAMACVALDTDVEQALFGHLIHRTTLARDIVLEASPKDKTTGARLRRRRL